MRGTLEEQQSRSFLLMADASWPRIRKELKRTGNIKLAVVLAVCLFAPELSAVEPVEISSALVKKSLGRHIEYLEDKSALLTAEEARGIDATRWKAIKGDVMQFSVSSSAYWIRFTARNSSAVPAPFRLTVEYPKLDYVDLHVPDARTSFTVSSTGDRRIFSRREMNYRNFVFKLELGPHEQKIYYLRVRSDYSSMFVPLYVWEPSKHDDHIQAEQLLYGIYFGFLTVMLLYNLFLFISVRDRTYFYYVCIVGFVLFGLMSLSGLGFQYVWPNSLTFTNSVQFFTIPPIVIFVTLFSVRYLDLETNSPRLRKALIAWNWCIAAYMLATPLVIAWSPSLATLLTGLAIIPPVTVWIFLAVSLCLKRYRPAYFYLTAWMCLLSVTFIRMMMLLEVFPAVEFVINWGLPLGSSLEAVLFSLGLADRINTMKNELKKLNADLEDRVQQRTAELQQKNDRMHFELKLAQEIQEVLLPARFLENARFRAVMRMEPYMEVSGDFCDIIKITESKYALVLFDVSGHGVPAALLTVMINMEISRQSMKNVPVREMCARINENYSARFMETGFYFTMFLAIIDFAGMEMDYVNCGHPWPIFIHGNDPLEELSTEGMPIGTASKIQFEEKRRPISARDRIILYTDGVTDASDVHGDTFGRERFLNIIEETKTSALEDQADALCIAVRDFKQHARREDDLTLVILEIA